MPVAAASRAIDTPSRPSSVASAAACSSTRARDRSPGARVRRPAPGVCGGAGVSRSGEAIIIDSIYARSYSILNGRTYKDSGGAVSAIETDYLVIGAGAAGMAFVDALITACDA